MEFVLEVRNALIILMILLEQHKAKGTGLAPWPARLTTPPPRLADFGYSAEMFEKDTVSCQKLSICLRLYIC
jgi:hypothetical protein